MHLPKIGAAAVNGLLVKNLCGADLDQLLAPQLQPEKILYRYRACTARRPLPPQHPGRANGSSDAEQAAQENRVEIGHFPKTVLTSGPVTSKVEFSTVPPFGGSAKAAKTVRSRYRRAVATAPGPLEVRYGAQS